MNDRDKKHDEDKAPPETPRDLTKPSGQDVGPPGERVDDETDGKTTTRQE